MQKETSDFAKRMIQEAIIEKLEMEIPSTLQIADFGCSVGPNTLMSAENLMEAVEKRISCSSKNNTIEFQVFFNDHTANDFNTLFASLPPPAGRRYYAAGVAGSFHGRLFPRGSITLAHSSFALHWLSGLPGGAWNEGRIFYAGAGEEVWKVYREQFERDIGGFMSARAQEIVKGGLMFLISPGIGDGGSHAHLPLRLTFDLLHSSLMDLVREVDHSCNFVFLFSIN